MIWDFDHSEHVTPEKAGNLKTRWPVIEPVVLKLLREAKITNVDDLCDLKLLGRNGSGKYHFFQ